MSILSIQVVSLNPPSLLVTTESDILLINTPSNLSRVLNANTFLPSMKELKHVYMDSLFSERQNGISGIFFAAANAGVTDFHISGPNNLYHYMQYFRFFVRKRNLDIFTNLVTAPIEHSYRNVNVKIIPFFENIAENLVTKEYEKQHKPEYILSNDTNRIYLGGFEESTKREDLLQWFGKYGKIESIELPHRPSDPLKSRQFGYITFLSKDSVKDVFDDWTYWKLEKGIHIACDTSLRVTPYFGDTWKVHHYENDNQEAEIPQITNKKSINCFILQAKDKRGKFDVNKAKELGVPKGSSYSQLTRGESVVTPEGRTVRPEDVIGESLPGGTVLIISIPDKKFLYQVTESEEWAPYYELQKDFVVYHLVQPEIVNTKVYQDFISKFSEKAQHILVNSNCNNHSQNQESQKLQILLHAISEDAYPIPFDGVLPEKKTSFQISEKKFIRNAALFEKYSLEPGKLGFTNNTQKLNIKELLPKYRNEVEDYWKSQNHRITPLPNDTNEILSKLDRDEGEFCILGTASANPSRLRGVTSIFINFYLAGCMIWDCGEGTLSQLYRVYGSKADTLLLNLQVIFISHLHADHHCDLVNILATRSKLGKSHGVELPPIVLIGNTLVDNYLKDAQASSYDENYNYVFVNGSQYDDSEYEEIFTALKKKFRLSKFEILRVVHGRCAYAIIIERFMKDFDDKYKIVFSGDCRPSFDLIEKGKNALILLHEATFASELNAEAISRKHSTVQEAIDVGKKMNARATILMHYSQRYPCAPPPLPKNVVGIYTAFDLLKLNLKDIKCLEHHTSMFEYFFKDEYDLTKERQQEFIESKDQESINEDEVLTCNYFSMGRCFSPECSFKHDPEQPFPICRYGEDCPFGIACWFKHDISR